MGGRLAMNCTERTALSRPDPLIALSTALGVTPDLACRTARSDRKRGTALKTLPPKNRLTLLPPHPSHAGTLHDTPLDSQPHFLSHPHVSNHSPRPLPPPPRPGPHASYARSLSVTALCFILAPPQPGSASSEHL